MKLLSLTILVSIFLYLQLQFITETIETRSELNTIINEQNEEISDLKSKLDECIETQLIVIDEATKWAKPKECKKGKK